MQVSYQVDLYVSIHATDMKLWVYEWRDSGAKRIPGFKVMGGMGV